MANLTVRLDDALADFIAEQAAAEGVSRSELVRRALADFGLHKASAPSKRVARERRRRIRQSYTRRGWTWLGGT